MPAGNKKEKHSMEDEEMWRLVSQYYAAVHDKSVSNEQRNVYFNLIAERLQYYFAAAKKFMIKDFFDVTESEWEEAFQCSMMSLWQSELEKWMVKYEKEKTGFFGFVMFNIRRAVHRIMVGRNQIDVNVAWLHGQIQKVSKEYGLEIIAENYHIFALVLNKNYGNISIARIASTVRQWRTMIPLDADRIDVLNRAM